MSARHVTGRKSLKSESKFRIEGSSSFHSLHVDVKIIRGKPFGVPDRPKILSLYYITFSDVTRGYLLY